MNFFSFPFFFIPGNPRNKCSLQPGHSLMDWIRLGSSGVDLTGVGSKAGHLSVSLLTMEIPLIFVTVSERVAFFYLYTFQMGIFSLYI